MTTIRRAEPRDYDAVLVLFRELGVDDPDPPREQWIEQAMPSVLVADDGGVIGYVATARLADVGHVRNLVVAPHARNAKVGERLMREAATRDLAGLPAWQLYVIASNPAAIKLYERLGMRAVFASHALRVPVTVTLPNDAPADVVPIEADEDAAVERALGWDAGRIAISRGRGRVLLGVRDGGWLGAAVYDPAFPGASPFGRVRGAPLGVARRLIEAFGAPTVQLVIDDDAELADALVAGGATLKMRLLRYRGPLPL